MNPAAQSLTINSNPSTSALSFTVATSGGSWLSATGTGGTPGSTTVSVNPANMSAGTYKGTVTITAAGASNSPQLIPVTLTITAAASPTIVANPTSLNFAYTSGGSMPASQSIGISSSTSTSFSYTVAATGGTWLTASGGGSSPGNVQVSVNPTGMSAGTYSGTVRITGTGTSNSPMNVPVVLTVSSSSGGGGGAGSLAVRPSQLVFYSDGSDPAPHSILINSSNGSPMTFTAEAFGGSWMAVSTPGGTTPGKVSVSVFTSGLPAGTYSGVVQIKSGNSSANVEIVLVVGSRGGYGGGDGGDAYVQPFTYDPGARNTVAASWQKPASGSSASGQSTAKLLTMSKSTQGPPSALSGALISGVEGTTVTQLGYDLKSGSECTARAPQFVVVTDDNVVHHAGCTQGRFFTTASADWQRVNFDPADASQFTPPLQPGTVAKTVAVVMARVEQNGTAVLSHIRLNGKRVSEQ